MSYNPYTQQVAALASHIKSLEDEQAAIGAKVTAYQEFGLEEQHQRKLEVTRQLKSEEDELQIELKEMDQASAAHSSAKGQEALKLRYLFSSQRSVAKQLLSECEKALNLISSKVAERKERIKSLSSSTAGLSSAIATYQTTDILELQARLNAIQVELSMSNNQLIKLSGNKTEIDDLISVQLESLRESERRCNVYREHIRRAEGFERDLNRAPNSYERREIHKRCEAVLGNGKPAAVISNRKSALAGEVATIEKLDQAIRLAVKRADVEIRSLVLDGSNLCNRQGNDFVGLTILRALAPVLLKKYSVTIVFDPGIRGMLKATNAEIRDQFPGAEVHVMKTKTSADETILNAAEFDLRSYVISRDRFKDYPQKRAVSEKRVLGFTVLNNTISIESLNIHVPLFDCSEEGVLNEH